MRLIVLFVEDNKTTHVVVMPVAVAGLMRLFTIDLLRDFEGSGDLPSVTKVISLANQSGINPMF